MKSDFLRRGDDHCAGERNELGNAELGIPGPRGKIDKEIIQIPPDHISEKLLNGRVNHGAAPCERRLFGNKKSHRNQLDAVAFGRQEFAVLLLRLLVNAHHHRHVGAVHVRVHQSNAGSLLGESARKVHCDRRFSDPALAAADRNGMFDSWDQVFFVVSRAGCARWIDLTHSFPFLLFSLVKLSGEFLPGTAQ